MTRDELAETITHAIQQLGFARIHVSAIVDVFEQASFTISDELKEFARGHGWTIREEDESFIAFYPQGSESPQVSA